MTSEPRPDVDGRADARFDSVRGGHAYALLHAAHRRLEDALAAAALPDDISQDVTAQLADLADVVEKHRVGEADRRDGFRADLPGRGMALMPPYLVDEERDGRIAGRVTFTRVYLGGNNTAHGGTPPLLFDDVLGRAMNDGLPGVARTAYLHTDYRRVTPLDVELRFEAVRDRVEGRKRFGTARIVDMAGNLLVECSALFVQLRPGQP